MTMHSVTLSSYGVTLRPTTTDDIDALIAAEADGLVNASHCIAAPSGDATLLREYLENGIAATKRGQQLCFTVITDTGDIVGSTRYYDIDASVPNCAIGYTFYAARVQRTHVNTACKRLLLGHAFHTLAMQAVYFHTSHENLRSQAAIERPGARKDGILRNHKRHKDGSLRHTVTYSIVDAEWPAIREALDARLAGLSRTPSPGS